MRSQESATILNELLQTLGNYFIEYILQTPDVTIQDIIKLQIILSIRSVATRGVITLLGEIRIKYLKVLTVAKKKKVLESERGRVQKVKVT